MRSAFKNLSLTTALLSISVSGYTAGANVKNLLPELQNPAKSAEIRALAAGDRETAGAILTEALRNDKGPAYRCAAIAALTTSKDGAVLMGLAGLLGAQDSAVRACAIRAAGESKNKLAAGGLLANIERYQSSAGKKSLHEDNIKARLKALDSIWALGEIGDPALMGKLTGFYEDADDVMRVNLVISIGKLKNNTKAGPYLAAIAASAQESAEVRAAAFEMLEETGQSASISDLLPSKTSGMEKADLLYIGSIGGTMGGLDTGDLLIGHVGIFAGTEVKNGRIYMVISDCVPNFFVPGGVRNIDSWKIFTHHFWYPYYGNRTTPRRPTAAQREEIVKLGLAMGKLGLRYTNSHISQKGPEEFDCVGYTEYLYEKAGLNPTPDAYEFNLGWPLTPWEQFTATRPNLPARESVTPQTATDLMLPLGDIAAANLIIREFGYLTANFGMEATQPLEVATEIRPEAVN